MTERVLSSKGADLGTLKEFYRCIIISILLYGSDTWTLTKKNKRILETFHNKCCRYITKDYIHKINEDEWYLPDMKKVLEKLKLNKIEDYVKDRKMNLSERYSRRCEILKVCKESKRHYRNVNQIVWW